MTPLADAVVSGARAAALAWQAAMQQRRQPCVMTPWDENTYCLNPISTRFSLTQNVDEIVAQANPQRVALIFSPDVAAIAALYLRPYYAVDPLAPCGISTRSNESPIIILQKHMLVLAQVEWHALTTAAICNLSVIEVCLREWPKV